jgi:hypothetical protein
MNDFCRVENKYFAPLNEAEYLSDLFFAHLDKDPFIGPQGYYQCNTIYFDNARFDVVYRSLEHPTWKEKLRLRSYGGEKPVYFLEFKRKFRSDVYKERISLSQKEYEDFVFKGLFPAPNGVYLHDRFLLSLEDFARRKGPLLPKELIQYRREAFMSKPLDPFLRLTIDYDIRVREQDFAINKLGGEPLSYAGKCLVECKIDRALPFWLAEGLSKAGAYRDPYSKCGSSYILFRESENKETASGDLSEEPKTTASFGNQGQLAKQHF